MTSILLRKTQLANYLASQQSYSFICPQTSRPRETINANIIIYAAILSWKTSRIIIFGLVTSIPNSPWVSNFLMMVSMIVVLGATWPRLTGISGTGFPDTWAAETFAFERAMGRTGPDSSQLIYRAVNTKALGKHSRRIMHEHGRKKHSTNWA